MIRRLAVIPLAALLFAATPIARATDAVVGTGSAGSCTELALQAAADIVNVSGGTLTFNCGGAPHTIAMTEQIRFNTPGASYTIDGGNLVTLDGGESTRLIYTASGRHLNLTVKDIALVNGYATGEPDSERARNQGGAIYSGYENTLTVQHVTFDNNRAQAQYHEYHGGGAIAIDTSSVVTITDSVFTNNRAPNGGAINNLISRLTIERSLFQNNQATRDDPGGGGAIYNDAGKLTIIDTHILSNSSDNLGGGIFSWANLVSDPWSGKTTIRNTVIDGNHAEHGGGLWKGGSFILELIDSSVTNNTATDGGAGISGTGPGKNFKIVNSTIAYNATSPNGTAGGIFSANASSTIVNSTIAFNTIPDDTVGAAIHGNVKVRNTIFLGNTGGWNGIWACQGTITNDGHNIQHPGGTCGSIPTKHALLDTVLQPPLGTLAFGQTQTLMPLAGSPAINKGADCPNEDQRGIPRPQGDKCDIGAVEKEGSAPPAPVIISPADGATGVALEPVLQWTSTGTTKVKFSITKTNGDVRFTQTTTDDCSSTCSYLLLQAGLKFDKKYVFVVQAFNDFGKTKAKATFRTAPQ